MNDAVVRGKVTTNSFGYIHIGAKHMLKQAEQSEEGQLYNLVGCLTFSAFTLEAFFNHYGKLKNPEWDRIERNYSKLKKYKFFSNENGIQYDFNVRPYSTIIELFKFRDTMAHGKSTTESVEKPIKLDPVHPNRFSTGAEWMEYATFENAYKAIEDVEKIVNELHFAGGFHGNPFANLGGGFFGVKI
jgi:hypothetical protein